MNALPPSSGWRSKIFEVFNKATVLYLLIFLVSCLYFEDERSKFLRNIGKALPDYTGESRNFYVISVTLAGWEHGYLAHIPSHFILHTCTFWECAVLLNQLVTKSGNRCSISAFHTEPHFSHLRMSCSAVMAGQQFPLFCFVSLLKGRYDWFHCIADRVCINKTVFKWNIQNANLVFMYFYVTSRTL
jgi:hypothetical protein